MADTTALKNRIRAAIKANDNQEITGPVLQQALLDMVDELNGATESEASQRQSGDNTLQQNINTEAQQRQNADATLQQNIATEAVLRQQGDTQLNNLITGIKNNIDNGYVYAGIATPSSTPVTGKVFYLALTAGTYTNFGSIDVSQGINILNYNGSAWSLDTLIGIDDELTPGSNKLPKSGNVLKNINKNGPAFDLSAYNAVNGVLATYVDLDTALSALNLLPAVYKQPGMSFKFVLTSDNMYVQFRYMGTSTATADFTNTANWQGVTNEVKAGSRDLVESGSLVLQDFEFNGNTTKVYLRTSGTYSRNAENYSLILPIKGLDNIYIKGGSGNTTCGFLKSYNAEQTVADFCDGITSTTSISANTEYELTSPADCRYIIVLVDYLGDNRTPQLMTINGYQVFPAIGKACFELWNNSVRYIAQSHTENEKMQARNNIGGASALELNNTKRVLYPNVLHQDYVGYITSGGHFSNASHSSYSIIPINAGDSIHIKANINIQTMYAFLKSYTDNMTDDADFCNNTSMSAVSVGSETTVTAPDDAKYLYIRNKGNDTNIYEPAVLTINGYDYYPLLRSEAKRLAQELNGIKGVTIPAIDGSVSLIETDLMDVEVSEIPFTVGKYINQSLEEVEESTFKYAKIACVAGDIFTINCSTDRSAARYYIFIDASNNILYIAPSGVQSVSWKEITAPDNAAYLILNDNSGRKSYKGKLMKSILNGIDTDIDNVESLAIGVGKRSDGGTAILLENQIAENWPYYLDVPALPVSFDDGNYLEQRIQSVPEGKHSLFITDSHFADNRNSGHGINIADYVKKRISASIVSFGGDCVNYVLSEPVSYSKYGGAARLTEYASKFFAAFGKEGIWTQGNHDCNSAAHFAEDAPYNDAVIPDTEAYKRTVRNIEDTVVFDDDGITNVRSAYNQIPTPTGWPSELNVMDEFVAWMKMHYYYDDKVNKVRYIVLETCDNGYTLYYTINKITLWLTFQIDFVAKALLSVPDGYDVIIHGHLIGSLGDNVGDAAYIDAAAQKQFLSMLNCYRRKTSKNLSAAYFGANDEANYPYVKAYWDIIGATHKYDFTNHKGSGRVIVVCGHYHMDLVLAAQNSNSFTEVNPATIDETTFSDDVVFLVWRNRDCFATPGHTEKTLYGVTPVMTEGTVSENSFDVMTIDNNYFYFTRFGANGSQGDLRLPY